MLPIVLRSSRARSTLALCALALAAASVSSQTAAPKHPAAPGAKTLSGKSPGGVKLMSREELRACLKRQEDLNLAAREVEALRPALDREREELRLSGEALKAERAEVDKQLAAVREWEARVRSHSAEIEAFNKRSAAVQEAARNQQEKLSEELKIERERLQQERSALGADETKLVPVYQNSTKVYNERALARDAKVSDWNTRNAAAVEASIKQQESRALWLNECANRPYLEDDEKAIKAGR